MFSSSCLIDLSHIPTNKQWRPVKVRVDKNTNVHPNLALVLLFVPSEVECGIGLLYGLQIEFLSSVWHSKHNIHVLYNQRK